MNMHNDYCLLLKQLAIQLSFRYFKRSMLHVDIINHIKEAMLAVLIIFIMKLLDKIKRRYQI